MTNDALIAMVSTLSGVLLAGIIGGVGFLIKSKTEDKKWRIDFLVNQIYSDNLDYKTRYSAWIECSNKFKKNGHVQGYVERNIIPHIND